MEYFDMSSINNPYYQCVVCRLSCGIVCYIYINPKINIAKLDEIMEWLAYYSYEGNFVSVIGDFNIRSEFGIETSTKLMEKKKKSMTFFIKRKRLMIKLQN